MFLQKKNILCYNIYIYDQSIYLAIVGNAMQSIHIFTILVIVAALLSLLASFDVALSARNEREEAICQPFLTSRKTSPLVENDPAKPLNLRRNLKVDEDGDFACRLVLQVLIAVHALSAYI